MIVIARSYGQLGNRLFLYGHMLAAAKHHGVQVANPCFAEYAHLFPATANDLWCRYPLVEQSGKPAPSLGQRKRLSKSVYLGASLLYRTRMRSYPYHVLKLRGEQRCDLGGDDFARRAKSNRHVLAMGWLFRNEELFQQHAGAVRDHFRLFTENQNHVDQKLGQVRQSADVVVGVHIRHGDYATFMGGKYFFSVDQYAAMMRNVAEQLSPRRVAFLVCSNLPLERSDFGDLNVHFGPGDIVEDMYSFAGTDMLVGPPSTYTGWASFYGDVPLCMMESADEPLELPSKLGRIAA